MPPALSPAQIAASCCVMLRGPTRYRTREQTRYRTHDAAGHLYALEMAELLVQVASRRPVEDAPAARVAS